MCALARVQGGWTGLHARNMRYVRVAPRQQGDIPLALNCPSACQAQHTPCGPQQQATYLEQPPYVTLGGLFCTARVVAHFLHSERGPRWGGWVKAWVAQMVWLGALIRHPSPDWSAA